MLIAVALLVAVAATAHAFDYFVLEVQWGGGMCASADCVRCPSNLAEWTMHGLWPSNFDGNDPAYCNSNWEFNADNISSILASMNKNWPSYEASTDNEAFWTHEWERHGTCAAVDPRFYGEYNFFSNALSVRTLVSVYSVLKRGHHSVVVQLLLVGQLCVGHPEQVRLQAHPVLLGRPRRLQR